jgi:type III secretion system low calcium response chaperone LcrH/SycD
MVEENALEALQSDKKYDPERGKSKLISPDPFRKKFVTEILVGLSERKLTYASVMRMNRKRLRQIAEQGYTKLKHGRYEEARKIFEILTFIDHKNFFYHLALGGTYQKLKKFLDAAFQYTECLKYSPDNTNALVNRGEVFLRHKNYKKAAEDFRAAIMNDKEGKDTFSNRARSLVIAIKRCIAKDKGQKTIKLPNSPSRRRKIKPLQLMSSKRKKRSNKKR